jgi:hypothetical protein
VICEHWATFSGVIWREDREFQSPVPNCEGPGAPVKFQEVVPSFRERTEKQNVFLFFLCRTRFQVLAVGLRSQDLAAQAVEGATAPESLDGVVQLPYLESLRQRKNLAHPSQCFLSGMEQPLDPLQAPIHLWVVGYGPPKILLVLICRSYSRNSGSCRRCAARWKGSAIGGIQAEMREMPHT